MKNKGIRSRRVLYPLIFLVTGAVLIAATALLIASTNGFYFAFKPKPDVVVFLVDALRSDHLGCYGHQVPTSPFIDRMAAQGVLFENCRSQAPWTKPSVASIFASLPSSAHHVVSYPRTRGESLDPRLGREDILPKQVTTIAEALSQEGYHTAAFVTNRWVDPLFGFHQGFDDFFSLHLQKQAESSEKVIVRLNTPADHVNLSIKDYLKKRKPANWQKYLAWIGLRRPPLFIYVHYMDVHGPYKPPVPFDRMFDNIYRDQPDRTLDKEHIEKYNYLYQGVDSLNFYRSRYDGQIRFLDRELESLMQWVGEEGFLSPAMMVLTSDHGESFLEHGALEHGNNLYEEEIHVPLIVWGLNLFPPGTRCQASVQLIDLAPTILEIAGAPPQPQFQGKSLLQTVNNPERVENDSWSENHIHGYSLVANISTNHKWIMDVGKKEIIELYDLSQDPGEKTNLIRNLAPKDKDKQAAAIIDWIKNQDQLISTPDDTPAGVLPDDIRKQLEALGYLQNKR